MIISLCLSFIIVLLICFLILDYLGPKEILLTQCEVFGLNCLRAKELIVQEFDNEGNLWASRGMIIYCLKPGSTKFIRRAHVPTGFSFFWFNNFKIFRRLTLRPECIEVTIAEDGLLCAFSSGRMWISFVDEGSFTETMRLPNFGKGVGRGIMSTGLLKLNMHKFYFGEYFSNPARNSVKIFKYNNIMPGWDTAYEFSPGKIRHIHALQSDPYTEKLWICTGDEDNEAMIGWSEDGFRNINPIGKGSQIWRTCQLVFTEEALYWGTDTGSEELAGIYKWDKSSKELKLLHKTDGAIFFATRLAGETIVMSTDREGFPNEKDERTRLLILNDAERVITLPCGTWEYKKPGFRFNFAKLRFQRNQGNSLLAISVLNQKEVSDGELLLIHEEELL